jgi:hypothetical protein
MPVDEVARSGDDLRRRFSTGIGDAHLGLAVVDEQPAPTVAGPLVGCCAPADRGRRHVGHRRRDPGLRRRPAGPFCVGTIEAGVVGEVFPGVSVSRQEGTARFDSIDTWLHPDIHGWTLAERIDDATSGRLLDEAHRELGRFTDDRGRVRFAAPALIATATAPA